MARARSARDLYAFNELERTPGRLLNRVMLMILRSSRFLVEITETQYQDFQMSRGFKLMMMIILKNKSEFGMEATPLIRRSSSQTHACVADPVELAG